jgi:hypothetical protein
VECNIASSLLSIVYLLFEYALLSIEWQTMTLDPKRKHKRTDRSIRDCWRKMRVSLAREFKGSLPFVGVLEFQKNGPDLNPALAALVKKFIGGRTSGFLFETSGGLPMSPRNIAERQLTSDPSLG